MGIVASAGACYTSGTLNAAHYKLKKIVAQYSRIGSTV